MQKRLEGECLWSRHHELLLAKKEWIFCQKFLINKKQHDESENSPHKGTTKATKNTMKK